MLNHTSHPLQSEILSHPAVQPPQRAHPSSFRRRGFSFLKKAGTNRNELNLRYMWRNATDWPRYIQSHFLKYYPALAPKPQADKHQYQYRLSVENPDEFSFIVVGDTGMNSPGQYLVTTALSRQDHYPSDFCMILGDVMYPAGGGQESYQYGLLEAFKHYSKPILALPGNHDWYDNLRAFRKFFIQGHQPASIGQKYAWKSPQLPNWYYFVDFGQHLRIVCLDTGLSGKMNLNKQSQLKWLDNVLETAGSRKVILMMHHPMYSLRQRGHEKALQELLEPRLKKANVVAVFSGHDHSYQRHTIAGIPHVIQGAGGASLHALPQTQEVHLPSGERQTLKKQENWDRHFSFTHCQWRNNQLTCSTISAHELPGRLLDRFVL